MALPNNSQYWQQTSHNVSEIDPFEQHGQQQQISAFTDAHAAASRTYRTVNVAGHAHAILGDVNINATDPTFFQATNPQYQKKMLLRSLYFEGMSTRKAQIDARASSPRYVEWIWKTNFLPWLEGPDKFYWVTGRPGSGKSSLMTHISSSARTKQALAKSGSQWKIVYFFFDFRAGQSLANNTKGLLRSLIRQIIRQVPEVLDCIDVDPADLNAESWTLQKCLDILCDAFEASSYPICVFIDGLDEFDGSYADLIDVIQQIGERVLNIKLCLASRPYSPFRDNLSAFASIALQDHNDESIKLYTSAQWSNHRIDHQAELPQDLSNRIRIKANGVFLWARLAVDELIVDMVAGKPVSELYAQIEEMPVEVEAMYQRILDRLSEPHQQEAAAILYMILQTTTPLAVDTIYATLSALISHGNAGKMILPVECEMNNSSRMLAILGDLTDQTLSPLDDGPYFNESAELDLVPPRLVMQGSTIKCKRERVMCISLTHETLRSFLDRSSWLKTKIPPRMAANAGHNFWIDLYLTEISVRMLINKGGDPIELRIRDSALEYGSRLSDVYGKDWEKTPYAADSTDNLPSQASDKLDHEVALSKLLVIWPNWSPFLLHSLEALPREISRLGAERVCLVNRIVPLCKSAAFALHMGICVFNSIDRFSRCYHGCDYPQSLRYWREQSCASRHWVEFAGLMKSRTINRITIDPIVAACHNLDDFIPKLLHAINVSEHRRQLFFDWVWGMCIGTWSGSSTPHDKAQKESLIQFLLLKGCQMEGRHFCWISASGSSNWDEWTASIALENVSELSWSHDPDCVFGEQTMLGFVEELGSLWYFYDDLRDGSFQKFQYKRILSILIDHGANLREINSRTGEILLVGQIQHTGMHGDGFRFADWVETLVEAGADPYQKGKSGDAFMAAQNLQNKVFKAIDGDLVAIHMSCLDCQEYREGDNDVNAIHEIRELWEVLHKYKS